MYNYSKLRGRIVEKFGSQESFCKHLDISSMALSKKLNNKIGLSQADIVKWANLLEIRDEDYKAYFFTQIVQSNLTN